MIEALVMYDVRTDDPEGQRRLRAVAKTCEGIGIRVQYSVFEVRCSAAQLVQLRARLAAIIRPRDSIRIYRMDHGALDRVEFIGQHGKLPPPDAVIL